MNRINCKKGFSAIEVLIVLSILAVISSVVLFSFSGFKNAQVLRHEVDQISSLLSKARSASTSSIDSSSYGVHIEEDRIIYFKGLVFDENNQANEIVEINNAVSISDIALSGDETEIIFDRLTGDASSYGTLTVSLVSDVSKQKVITITRTGIISVE